MSKRISFKERLKANILAAQLADALENNEYQGQESPAQTEAAESVPGHVPGPGSALEQARNVVQPLDSQTDTLSGRQADRFTRSMADRPSGPLSDSHSDRQINRHSFYHSDNLSREQSGSHPPLPHTTTDPALCMTDTQARVLAYFISSRVEVIKYEELTAALDIPYGTVRWAVSRLEKERFLAKRKFRKGRIQGIAVTLNEAACQDFARKRMDGIPGNNTSHSTQHSNYHSTKQSDEFTLQKTHSLADASPLLKKDRKEDSFSLKLLSLTEEDLAFHYPHLHRHGFGEAQIRQVLERLEKVDKSPDRLFVSLEHAEWELAQGGIADKDGNPVENPCAFVFTALAKTGYYRRPKGFVSTEEVAAREAEERLEAERKARDRREAAEFERWRQGLDPGERERLLTGSRGPEEQWLKNHYLKHVKADRTEHL